MASRQKSYRKRRRVRRVLPEPSDALSGFLSRLGIELGEASRERISGARQAVATNVAGIKSLTDHAEGMFVELVERANAIAETHRRAWILELEEKLKLQGIPSSISRGAEEQQVELGQLQSETLAGLNDALAEAESADRELAEMETVASEAEQDNADADAGDDSSDGGSGDGEGGGDGE